MTKSNSVRDIVSAVAKTFGTTSPKILSKGREAAAVARARQVAIYVHKTRTKSTNAKTAEAFGRSAPAVTYSLKKVTELMGKNRKFKQQVNSLT